MSAGCSLHARSLPDGNDNMGGATNANDSFDDNKGPMIFPNKYEYSDILFVNVIFYIDIPIQLL